MLKKHHKLFFPPLFITLAGILLSCATDSSPLPKQSRLPENERIYYSDEFNNLREDLWDPAGYLYRNEQMQNFKQADTQFEEGKLIIQTQTGSFSKGGLSSKYAFRGDFEVQLDCRMDFVKGLSQADMDQLFSFAVFDKNLKPGKMNFAIIGLAMKGGTDLGYIFGNYILNGKRQKGFSLRLERFDGSMRIVRKNKNISLLYKTRDAATWKRIRTLRLTGNDMLAGFQLRNFFNDRTVIQATDSISIEIDRFTINAAQEILEEEI